MLHYRLSMFLLTAFVATGSVASSQSNDLEPREHAWNGDSLCGRCHTDVEQKNVNYGDVLQSSVEFECEMGQLDVRLAEVRDRFRVDIYTVDGERIGEVRCPPLVARREKHEETRGLKQVRLQEGHSIGAALRIATGPRLLAARSEDQESLTVSVLGPGTYLLQGVVRQDFVMAPDEPSEAVRIAKLRVAATSPPLKVEVRSTSVDAEVMKRSRMRKGLVPRIALEKPRVAFGERYRVRLSLLNDSESPALLFNPLYDSRLLASTGALHLFDATGESVTDYLQHPYSGSFRGQRASDWLDLPPDVVYGRQYELKGGIGKFGKYLDYGPHDFQFWYFDRRSDPPKTWRSRKVPVTFGFEK